MTFILRTTNHLPSLLSKLPLVSKVVDIQHGGNHWGGGVQNSFRPPKEVPWILIQTDSFFKEMNITGGQLKSAELFVNRFQVQQIPTGA